jgi:antitoxin Phd
MIRSRKWQLQEAKNRLSHVVDEAERGTPQIITRRGKNTAVVVSFQKYEQMTASGPRLIQLLRRAPRFRGGLVVDRETDLGRDVDL